MKRFAPSFPLVAVLASTLAGCNACEKNKPYVPYSIDPSLDATTPSTASIVLPETAPPKDTGRFSPVVAKRIDGNAVNVSTGSGTITAPKGSVFELLLETDGTANNKPDIIAWMRSADGTGGELVQFASAREDGPLRPRTLVPLPADLTLRSGCKATTDLRQVGPRTLALSFRRTCSESEQQNVTEWVAVVVPVRDPAIRLAFLIDQPSDEERLTVLLDGMDRDGDQFDDLLATIEMTGSPKQLDEKSVEGASVILRYFDRPAGLSRDPHEPSTSFLSSAQRLERLAKGNQRDGIWAAARTTRRIHHMLCAEGGRPRVRLGGAPVQCGATESMQRIAGAELEAALGGKDLISAVEAYERLVVQGASAKDMDAARKRLEKDAPRKDVASYHLPFGPSAGEGVSWGPLAFHGDGSLLIRTDASVMRFDPKSRVALPDPEQGPIAPWGTKVQSPNGSTVLDGVVDPCDGGLLQVRLRRDGSLLELPLPIDPMTTRGCLDASPRLVGANPLTWTDSQLILLVAGGPVRIAADSSKTARWSPGTLLEGSKVIAGSPRSPNGRTLAHASSLGVLVVESEGKGSLWRSGSMASGYEKLSACTVSNGATAVACMDGTRTRVFVSSNP